jgi:putative tryptophan/tyrosine transport system substrate-binding protein
MIVENKRNILVIILFGLIFIGILVIKRRIIKKHNHFTIGIIQTASHPALDAVREGFIAQIKRETDTIDFVVRNGQGSITNIHTIAEQFHAKSDIDALFAIATPAMQAAISVEKEKPIIVAAVTITPELGIAIAEDNVCGVSDMIDVQKEIQAMKEILPESINNIGIVYSTAEINSVTMAHIMVKELEKIGFIPMLIGISSESDIEPALLSALRKVDGIVCPTDNMVANAIALIADIMQKANKPLIVSDNLLVAKGALMARGVDYYESGKQAGTIAVNVLMNGKKPQELSVIRTENNDIYLNKRIAEQLGYTISENVIKKAILVDY